MPIYEYRCPSCGQVYEKLMRMGAREAPPCPACGAGGGKRLLSAIARPVGESTLCAPCAATGA